MSKMKTDINPLTLRLEVLLLVFLLLISELITGCSWSKNSTRSNAADGEGVSNKYRELTVQEAENVSDLRVVWDSPPTPIHLMDFDGRAHHAKLIDDSGAIVGTLTVKASQKFTNPKPLHQFGGAYNQLTRVKTMGLNHVSINLFEWRSTIRVPPETSDLFNEPWLHQTRVSVSRDRTSNRANYVVVKLGGGDGERAYHSAFVFYQDRFGFIIPPRRMLQLL
jgi:hypothetical protein